MDSFRVSSWAADSGSPGFEVSVVVNAFPHSTQLFKCCETRQLDKAFPMYKYLRMLQEIIRKSSRFESDYQIPWIFSILEMYLTCVSTHILTKTLKEAFMAHKTWLIKHFQLPWFNLGIFFKIRNTFKRFRKPFPFEMLFAFCSALTSAGFSSDFSTLAHFCSLEHCATLVSFAFC